MPKVITELGAELNFQAESSFLWLAAKQETSWGRRGRILKVSDFQTCWLGSFKASNTMYI